ncbi:MAG: GatB/YqeY domain-containing protein [Myxococcaceae bacterium]|nr:GatB/YqeY domain-containing protein [Myxococcaceae bacterium]
MATLKERMTDDMKDAMRAKDELKTNVLRMAKSAVKYKEVEPGASALDDAGVMGVLGTMIKQRRDSLEQFKQGGRADLAEKEEKEIAILQSYLPTQLSAEQLSAEVAKAVTESGAKSAKDMGAVMKILTPRLKGQAEGKAISEEVKNQLSKL